MQKNRFWHIFWTPKTRKTRWPNFLPRNSFFGPEIPEFDPPHPNLANFIDKFRPYNFDRRLALKPEIGPKVGLYTKPHIPPPKIGPNAKFALSPSGIRFLPGESRRIDEIQGGSKLGVKFWVSGPFFSFFGVKILLRIDFLGLN